MRMQNPEQPHFYKIERLDVTLTGFRKLIEQHEPTIGQWYVGMVFNADVNQYFAWGECGEYMGNGLFLADSKPGEPKRKRVFMRRFNHITKQL